MEIIIAIVAVLLFSVADGLSDSFILRWIRMTPDGHTDRNPLRSAARSEARAIQAHDFNANWHRAQAARQAVVIGAVALLSTWEIIPLGAALFWLVQDGIVNVVGLDRSFFYVGATAWIDRQFQKTGKPELFMAIAKIGLLAVGVAAFFV